MSDGSKKNIEDIKIGEYVKSYDEKTSEIVNSKVTEVFHHSTEEMTDYYLIINNKIKITPNHIVMLNGKWEEIGKANLGDYLINEKGGNIGIESIEKVYDKVPTYNLEIENTHTYIADSIVHNQVKP